MEIRYSESISWTELGEFAFVFEEVSDTIYRFEGILKDFWLAIDKNSNLDDIIDLLLSKYDVEKTVLYIDIMKSVKSLENCGLLLKEE